MKCRKAVFQRYAQQRPEYAPRKYRSITSDRFIRALDQCIATGGQSF